MPIGDYCTRTVQTITPGESLRDAARRMDGKGVGCLVVVEDRKVVGVITDRDIALAATHDGLNPDAVAVSELLEGDLHVVHAHRPLVIALSMMRSHAVRRLPVLDREDHLIGLISSDDVLKLLSSELVDLAGAAAAQAPGEGEVAR